MLQPRRGQNSGGRPLPAAAVRAFVQHFIDEDWPRIPGSLSQYVQTAKRTPSDEPGKSSWDIMLAGALAAAETAATAAPGGKWTLGNVMALKLRFDSFLTTGIAAAGHAQNLFLGGSRGGSSGGSVGF